MQHTIHKEDIFYSLFRMGTIAENTKSSSEYYMKLRLFMSQTMMKNKNVVTDFVVILC